LSTDKVMQMDQIDSAYEIQVYGYQLTSLQKSWSSAQEAFAIHTGNYFKFLHSYIKNTVLVQDSCKTILSPNSTD